MPDGTQRDYRRTVRTIRSGTGLMTLSVVSMQYYLQSVVPSEMPPSWSAAALQVQAVAARTFAAYEIAHQPAGTPYDTCDSTACQVYKGLAGYSTSGTLTPFETTATTAAVSATSGLGVFYGGALALTQFSSSNGGQTVASSLPYQVSKVDPYDDGPVRQLEPVDHDAVDQQDRRAPTRPRAPSGRCGSTPVTASTRGTAGSRA